MGRNPAVAQQFRLTAASVLAQGRLVFPAFGEYIRLHPPFNYIAVTAALYGVAFLVFLHVAGEAFGHNGCHLFLIAQPADEPPAEMRGVRKTCHCGLASGILLHAHVTLKWHTGLLGDAVASTLDGAALMIAAGAGALAAGVPITVMPAPLLAAGGLAMYLDTDALRDYLLFVAGALGTGMTHIKQIMTYITQFVNRHCTWTPTRCGTACCSSPAL